MLSLHKSTHVFNGSVQWFWTDLDAVDPQPEDLRDTSKNLWIYMSAKDFQNTEYCLTKHTSFLRLQKVGIHCSQRSTTMRAEKEAGKPQWAGAFKTNYQNDL